MFVQTLKTMNSMKKIIFTFLISLIFLTSCYNIHKTEPISTKGYLVKATYLPEHVEYCYHYGYNFMSGKYNYHWRNEEHPAEYKTIFVFLNDTLDYNSKKMYDIITDTFTVIYRDRYKMKDNDSSFINHDIQQIIIKNDTINL
jgi:hypothetical protein